MRIRTACVAIGAVWSLSGAVAIAQPTAPTEASSAIATEDANSTLSAEQSQMMTQWVVAVSVALAALSLLAAAAQYKSKNRWHRIDFLRQAVRQFEQDPDIWKALKILDFEEYRDYEITYRDRPISFRVNNDLLCAALATHEERIKRKQKLDELLKQEGQLDERYFEQYQIETAIRDWFNKMLNGLEHFGYFIESGLFTANEIRPWMIYWIRLIADRAYKRPGASKFYDQLYTYIHEYGFAGVINLFEQFGYRILPTPYKDADFVSIKQGLFGFELQTALSLAKAAYLVYEDMGYVAEISQRWGIEVKNGFRYFNNRSRDTQAFMMRTPNFMVLSFRGSQELKDWQTNFSTRLRKFAIKSAMEPLQEDWTPPRGQVHRGFQSAWDSVEGSVIQQIHRWNEGRHEPLPLLICGHSLGGAVATVAAASLSKRKFNVQGLYTFGQPRVGDLVFVAEIGKELDGKVFRFVNNNDIVPHVPPPYLPWNPMRLYVHMGQMFYFNARGTLTRRPNPVVRLIDFFVGLMRDAFEPGFDLINDHRMEFYISNLKKAVELEREKERMEKENS